jgi:hypothetical protein
VSRAAIPWLSQFESAPTGNRPPCDGLSAIDPEAEIPGNLDYNG